MTKKAESKMPGLEKNNFLSGKHFNIVHFETTA